MGTDLTILADLLFDGFEVKKGDFRVDVAGDIISSVSEKPAGTPDGAAVLDLTGSLLAPGLINTHTHTARGGMFDPNEFISVDGIVRNFRDMLRAGVTGLGEMGNAAGLTCTLRERFRRNPECGPDVFGCGPLLTAPGGYPLNWMPRTTAMLGVALPCATPDDGRRAVRSVVSSRMDGVKLAIMHRSYAEKPIPAVSLETARAIVEEAHLHGGKVFCHAHFPEDYEKALDAGVDALMHSCFEPLEPAMVERVRESGVFYCPTLSVFENNLNGVEGRWDTDPRYLALVSQRVARDWTAFCDEFASSPEVVPSGIAGGLPKERGREALRNAPENFRRLAGAGVPVVFGTDASYGFALLGRPCDELAAMHRAGMAGVECLRSATSTAAGLLGFNSGVIKPGARADLVALDPECLEDPARVRNVRAVVRAGRPLADSPARSASRAALTALSVAAGVGRTLVWAATRRP